VSFKIHLSTISVLLKYILILQYTLIHLSDTLQYIQKTLYAFDICYNTNTIFNMLQYTSMYVEIVQQPLFSLPLCLVNV
jgi:hypothetical protein